MAETIPFEKWKEYRQKGRTNLIWLCRQILGYKDVNRDVHGQLLNSLQKFQGGTEIADGLKIKVTIKDGAGFTAACEMWDLTGPRKSLILIPRGHLKSTVATIAHTIQWIINYPNVRILLSSATGDQVKKFLSEIKGHFQYNEMFRWLYPEFCPHGRNIKEFGNQEAFTVPCRTTHRKEPTVSTCSVGAVVAGGHFDIIKNDDIVDKENVRTPEQIFTVKSHYGFLWPLLETSDRPPFRGWMDVIGTRYDFSDLYGTIIDGERDKAEDQRSWHQLQQSAIVSGDLTDLATCVTLWPSRMPPQSLKEIQDDPLQGPSVLSSQYLMNPIPSKSGLVESEDELAWIPRKDLDPLLARLSQHVTVDLAGMEPSTNKLADNDFTVINHHGFGQDGRLYVNRVWRGRYSPFEVIELMFKIMELYPRTMDIKFPKDHFTRVLLPFLKREMSKRNKFLPVVECSINNRISKQQKIKGLQPWFRNRSIVHAQDLDCKLAVINEIMRFPRYSHDDYLDTLADAMEGRDGEVTPDVMGRPKTDAERELYRETVDASGTVNREWNSPFPPAMTWQMLQEDQNTEVEQYCNITGW